MSDLNNRTPSESKKEPKIKDKLKTGWKSVKGKWQEYQATKNISSDGKSSDLKIPQYICLNCQNIVPIELSKEIFKGNQIICEKCGRDLTLKDFQNN